MYIIINIPTGLYIVMYIIINIPTGLYIVMYIIINIPTGLYIDLNEYVHQSYIVEMIGGYATKDGEIF